MWWLFELKKCIKSPNKRMWPFWGETECVCVSVQDLSLKHSENEKQ